MTLEELSKQDFNAQEEVTVNALVLKEMAADIVKLRRYKSNVDATIEAYQGTIRMLKEDKPKRLDITI